MVGLGDGDGDGLGEGDGDGEGLGDGLGLGEGLGVGVGLVVAMGVGVTIDPPESPPPQPLAKSIDASVVACRFIRVSPACGFYPQRTAPNPAPFDSASGQAPASVRARVCCVRVKGRPDPPAQRQGLPS